MEQSKKIMSAGKGDKPRNCFSNNFKNNYSKINWHRIKTIDEVCGVPKGSFQKSIEEERQKQKQQDDAREKRIRERKSK